MTAKSKHAMTKQEIIHAQLEALADHLAEQTPKNSKAMNA